MINIFLKIMIPIISIMIILCFYALIQLEEKHNFYFDQEDNYTCIIDNKKMNNGFYIINNINRKNGFEMEVLFNIFLINEKIKINRNNCYLTTPMISHSEIDDMYDDIIKKTYENGYELKCSYGKIKDIVSKKRGWWKTGLSNEFKNKQSLHTFKYDECDPVLNPKIVDLDKDQL